jgi:diguanylate cyclase (GGDEF)-like protein
MLVIVWGYAIGLLATIVACSVIANNRHGGRGLWWLVGALACSLVGLLLLVGRSHLPLFLGFVLANMVIFVSSALLYQSIAAILESSLRYIKLSVLLGLALFFFSLYFTYALPDVRACIMARTAAVLLQMIACIVVLFRQKQPALRDPIRAVVSVLLIFSALQVFRLAAAMVWAPLPDPLHPHPVQAFFMLFTYILALGCGFAVMWLALCAKKNDLHLMATTDDLSGLLNRRAFLSVLEREFQTDERRRRQMALLLIDLDHFKSINDDHGHQVGDEVIRRVGQLLWVNTREMDAVARYGGEEFVMLLRGTGLLQAESIAERLRSQIEAMAGLPEPIRITASIGVAIKTPDDTVASILERSDEALYVSKRTGRNRISTHYAYAEY